VYVVRVLSFLQILTSPMKLFPSRASLYDTARVCLRIQLHGDGYLIASPIIEEAKCLSLGIDRDALCLGEESRTFLQRAASLSSPKLPDASRSKYLTRRFRIIYRQARNPVFFGLGFLVC
jgi:hypothetical protein